MCLMVASKYSSSGEPCGGFTPLVASVCSNLGCSSSKSGYSLISSCRGLGNFIMFIVAMKSGWQGHDRFRIVDKSG